MAASNDLINFDIIEAQKENIQAIPSGRSAKKLAEAFSPSPLHKLATPKPKDTKNVNDCIRAEYEAEVASISESDDPLDVFDRYVRWTLDAYPSAQATSQSQLHTLLERATKTFMNSTQYRNDPRYLKLWMLYIQFFADAPRETFLFMSRHHIGEGMALYYEEYAAWLEGVGRWAQAEEVYKLGIEREARPPQRLMRKFKEFEDRRNQQTDLPDEASSPALPTVRPALAAKVDPFAAARAAAADPQAPRPSQGVGGQGSKPAKAKMSIFSDAEAAAPTLSSHGDDARGWDTIDSLENRKKENVMEAKPWVGETLKAGGKKSAAPKMQVFRDTTQSQEQRAKSHITLVPSTVQVMVNPMNGKREQVFVNLEAVYPTPEEPGSELSFEEVWAMNRGWLNQSWDEDLLMDAQFPEPDVNGLGHVVSEKLVIHTETVSLDENGAIQKKDSKPKKKKVMEVNETQTIKANLDSSPKGKMKKRNAAEPTMTLHTKAATDEIYEIFNQPLKQPREDDEEIGDEDGYETDGDYESGADSTTMTMRQIDVNEDGDGDDETSDAKSVSEWSDFSTRRHVPDIDAQDDAHEEPNDTQVSDLLDLQHHSEPSGTVASEHTGPQQEGGEEPAEDEDEDEDEQPRTMFVPIPPEDYEPRMWPYRDAAEVANNRLPFMTPITERTETSMGSHTNPRSAYNSPSQREDHGPIAEEVEEDGIGDLDVLPSSPLREVVTDESPAKIAQPILAKSKTKAVSTQPIPRKGPIIKDAQCNPVDDAVRIEILAEMHPPLSSYAGFYGHREEKYERGGEIRRVAKAMTKAKSSGDRTSNALPVVNMEFPDTTTWYTLRKELGAGAFAPVYLVENSCVEQVDENEENGVMAMGKGAFAVRPRQAHEALKMEHPPSAWEFHMMRVAHTRLGPHHRAASSLSYAHEMHLYQDEGFLFLPYHPHGSLLDVVNLFRAEPSAVMDEQLAMFFTIELLRTVEALHAHGVMHGDLKPDNCLLRLDALGGHSNGNGHGHHGQGHHNHNDSAPLATQYRADGTGGWDRRGVVLIDFGRAIDARNFAPETQFVADWKTSAHDCAEMREGRPWTWQIDYHGLGGIVHCLLFGRYIETVRCDHGGIGSAGRRYRVRESLKRYWQADLWGECFDLLLNPVSYVTSEVESVGVGGEGQCQEMVGGMRGGGVGSGRMPVLGGMRRVREKMESWLEANCERGVGLKSLVGKVEAYARARK